jgi:hypothetical protein
MSNPALASSDRLSTILVVVTVAIALLLGSAAVLWAHYGTTVFYEMIAAGLAYCF